MTTNERIWQTTAAHISQPADAAMGRFTERCLMGALRDAGASDAAARRWVLLVNEHRLANLFARQKAHRALLAQVVTPKWSF